MWARLSTHNATFYFSVSLWANWQNSNILSKENPTYRGYMICSLFFFLRSIDHMLTDRLIINSRNVYTPMNVS